MSELPGCVTPAGHIGQGPDREPGLARHGALPPRLTSAALSSDAVMLSEVVQGAASLHCRKPTCLLAAK